ncbi:MAG: hypothetical protein R3C61_15245 [Bacteroidia bacterium]
MRKLTLFALFSLLAFAACNVEPVIPDPNENENAVNFAAPAVGQKSLFLHYTTTCQHLNKDFAFTGDTLILEVIEKSGQIHLRESLTPTSPMYVSGAFQQPIEYSLTSTGDYALIPDRWSSALFYFYGNDTLRLNYPTYVTLVQNDCKLMLSGNPFIGDEVGFVKSFEFGDIRQTEKTVVSCIPVMFQLDAYLITDARHLYMSHTVIDDMGPNQDQVQGWVGI